MKRTALQYAELEPEVIYSDTSDASYVFQLTTGTTVFGQVSSSVPSAQIEVEVERPDQDIDLSSGTVLLHQ
jgi:hypothetical protein